MEIQRRRTVGKIKSFRSGTRKRLQRKKKKTKLTRNNNHCSPHALKNNIVSGSCLTKDAILKITEAHNKHNPQNSISDKLLPKDKLIKLREKMSGIPQCDQETCWLSKVKLREKDKNILQAQLFVPAKPTEWSKNPNTWLTNFDIENVLNQYEKSNPEFSFIGPSPIDFDSRPNKTECVCNKLCNFSIEKLLTQGKTKIGVVFNLDPHDKGGSHWVAMFIDLQDKFIFYFNSTGEKIQPQLKKFKNMVITQGVSRFGKMDYYENTFEHQKSNTECGMYCLYFIITCLLRESDIFNTSDDDANKMETHALVSYFTDERIPDKLVEDYRMELFR